MTNYAKTREVLEKAGLKYNKSGEELKEDKWFQQVKNPRTEDYFQWSDLKQVGIDPPDELYAKRRYPIKTVNTIFRVHTVDDKEFLMSRQTWTGLDRNGNEVSKSMDDMETWLKPILRYESRQVDPRDRFSKIERKVAGVDTQVKVFEKAFSAKALDELYSLRSPTCSLIVMNVDLRGEKVGHPFSVTSYEDFRNRPFNELFEYVSTPRISEQTKMGREELGERNKQYA